MTGKGRICQVVDDRAASSGSDEETWITRAQQGDRQAFGELVRLHRPGVVNVVYRMCGEPAVAEEAAQEAFLRAWLNLGRYNPRFTFRNWVYRIALNVAVDSLRRERPTSDIDAEPLESGAVGPEAWLERKQLAEQVQQAVLDLPPASRAVLVLREYEALSYQEIAEALDIPMGTVMSRLNYARGQMRRALGQLREAP
jgi:RNA polymerase sigma-70 factor (ECF subfamily)